LTLINILLLILPLCLVSKGDPVRDKENLAKELEQHKKDQEKESTRESSWGTRRAPTEEVRTSGEGWTSSSKSALASGRDDVAASSPPGQGWKSSTTRENTGTSSWSRLNGKDRGAEPVAIPGPQIPSFHSGKSATTKKAPAPPGNADKVDVWSRGKAFTAEPAATTPKTDT
jgi:hypothetical protein